LLNSIIMLKANSFTCWLEIRKIDAEKKSAYEKAKYLNPEYVDG
jgi:hypothetical protein